MLVIYWASQLNCRHHENPPAHSSERKKFKLKHNHHKQPKHLLDLTVFGEHNDDEFAADIAVKLNEDNLELIKKVVSAIGMDECVNFYKKTQKIEQNGGMLTVVRSIYIILICVK